jgi:hypothetical protein
MKQTSYIIPVFHNNELMRVANSGLGWLPAGTGERGALGWLPIGTGERGFCDKMVLDTGANVERGEITEGFGVEK